MSSSSVHVFHLTGIFFIVVGVLLSLWTLSFSIGAFLSNLPFLLFVSRSISLSSPVYLFVFYLSISLSTAFLKSVPCNAFGKCAKDRGLKTATNVVLREELDGRRGVVGSATVSAVGVTDPEEFQRCLNGTDLNLGSASGLLVK